MPQMQVDSKPVRKVYLGHIAALGAVFLFGSAYVGAKFALQTMRPLTAAVYRFFIASLIAWPLLVLFRGVQPVRRKDWPDLIGTALFNTTLYFSIQYVGLRFTTASNTGLIVNSRPIFLAVLAVIVFKEKLTFRQWGALALAFAGVVFIVRDPGNGSSMPNQLFGDMLIVLNALIGAVGIIFSKRSLKVFSPFTLLVYQISLGLIGLLPIALLESGISVFDTSSVAWAPIIFLAVFCTVIAQVLMYISLNYLPVSIAGAYLFIVPVINAILSIAILGESFSYTLIVGGIMILVGTYVISLDQNQNVESKRNGEV